jgi:hypothetical protein
MKRRKSINLSPRRARGTPGRWERACCISRPTARTSPNRAALRQAQSLLRSAAARTRDALWSTIGQALDAFPEAECQNYLANSGYEFTSVETALALVPGDGSILLSAALWAAQCRVLFPWPQKRTTSGISPQRFDAKLDRDARD